MNSWVENGAIAVLVGGFFFFASFLPGLVWQYRRYGAFSFTRMIGLAAVCLYGTALVAYTLLPLPERSEAWCAAHRVHANLTPFDFVTDIRRKTAGLSALQTIKSFVVLQAAFNVVLFIPLGTIVRRYFHRSVLATIIIGAATSLLIEATQLTGLWGISPCAYRVSDVDDLMLNTLGTTVGVLLAPAALFWMPNARKLRETRLLPRPLTVFRRWLGMTLDLLLMLGITLTVQMTLAIFFDPGTETPFPDTTMPVGFLVAWLVVFGIPAWNGSAASIGQMAVWVTPKWWDGMQWTDGTRARRVAHASVVAAPIFLLALVGPGVVGGLLFWIVLAAYAAVPFTRGKRGLSSMVTGADMRDAREDQRIDADAPKVGADA